MSRACVPVNTESANREGVGGRKIVSMRCKGVGARDLANRFLTFEVAFDSNEALAGRNGGAEPVRMVHSGICCKGVDRRTRGSLGPRRGGINCPNRTAEDKPSGGFTR